MGQSLKLCLWRKSVFWFCDKPFHVQELDLFLLQIQSVLAGGGQVNSASSQKRQRFEIFAGHFGDRQKFDIACLVTTYDLLGLHVVLCDFRFQGHSYRPYPRQCPGRYGACCFHHMRARGTPKRSHLDLANCYWVYLDGKVSSILLGLTVKP